MAPRTLLPCRMSGCSRVARVTATASPTRRSYRSLGQPGQRCAQRHDAPLGRGVLIADGQAADPVVHRCGQTGGAHVVVRVHRGNDAERGRRGHGPGRGHRDLAFGHRGEQRVDGVLGRPVELLDVQEAALAHGPQQRPVDEVVRAVVLAQHPGRVVVADQLGRGEVGVALDEDQRDAPLGRDGPQQGALAGPGRSLQDDVPARGHRREHQRQLALAADQVRGHPVVGGREVRTCAHLTSEPASMGSVTPVMKATLPATRPAIACLLFATWAT